MFSSHRVGPKRPRFQVTPGHWRTGWLPPGAARFWQAWMSGSPVSTPWPSPSSSPLPRSALPRPQAQPATCLWSSEGCAPARLLPLPWCPALPSWAFLLPSSPVHVAPLHPGHCSSWDCIPLGAVCSPASCS